MSNISSLKFASYGEVLFDVFDNQKNIGGAPLNLALRIKSFGPHVSMISAIGNDENGKILKAYIEKEGLDVKGLAITEKHKTGLVEVTLDEKGSASYIINHPSAWDKIKLNTEIKQIVSTADVLLYGSLACRDDQSKSTLFELLKCKKPFKVFDINLRPPHYKIDIIKYLMENSDFIKFNDEELFIISKLLGSKYNALEQNLKFIAKKTNTTQICVTKGKHGAVFYNQGKLYYNSGYEIKVKDTVGSGDSFLASLIYKLFTGATSQEAIDFACAVGALVAERTGANPVISDMQIKQFMNPYTDFNGN